MSRPLKMGSSTCTSSVQSEYSSIATLPASALVVGSGSFLPVLSQNLGVFTQET